MLRFTSKNLEMFGVIFFQMFCQEYVEAEAQGY